MTSPAEITVELVQQILKEAEKDNTIVVLPDLEVKELNEDLHGGSCLNRVTVKYTCQNDTTPHSVSLLVKLVPQNSINTELVQQSSVFVREIQMFDEILPRMSALLSRALPYSHTDFSARVYYTRKTPSYLIAIEDLSLKGFKAPKRINGLDLKHCLLALRALARFHAASVMIRQENESWFAVFDQHAFLEKGFIEVMNKMTNKIVTAVTQAMELSPDLGSSWADLVRQRSQTLHEDLQHVLKRDDSAFNVLNHSDFGAHNVMYRYSETSGEVEEIMLVDFQLCSYCSPVLDLHQFIFGSASDDVREHHIDKLLREYHSELTTTLEALGEPQDKIISLSQLHDEFNSKMLYGFYYTLTALFFLNIDRENNPDLHLDEIFNASEDTGKLHLLVTDSYLRSLKKSIIVFRQNKFL